MLVKIKDFAQVVSGSTPSTKHPEYYDGDIIWITPKDLSVQNSKYISRGERTITKLGYDSCSTQIIPKNNVLMSSRAPIGLFSINTEDCCTNQGFKSFIVDTDKCLSEFLYYYLKYHIKEVEALGSGTTFKEVSRSSMEEFEVDLPPIEEQKRIVNLLSAIDLKIINNNKINTELESMAKTIYDYWFLQFEFPNENGKPYKSSGGRMVWNEELKRDIPDGWEPCHIRDCIKHINTGLNPRDNFKLGKGSIRYITVKNLTNNGTIDFTSCDVIDEEARAIVHRRSDVSKGDILFASIAPLGRCVIVQENPVDWDINESVFSIRPNTDKVSTEHLYMFFMSDYFIKKAEHNSTGSVFSGIRVGTLEDMYILLPPHVIREKFKSTVEDILYKKYLNDQENQELASLRDFLLPLLLSGKVKFKSPDKEKEYSPQSLDDLINKATCEGDIREPLPSCRKKEQPIL